MRLNYPPELFFECIRCGICCRDTGRRKRKILLTSVDMRNIMAVTGLPSDEFCEATQASEPFHYAMSKDSGVCVFLDDTSMCKIYDSRPLICRCYPFSVEFVNSKTISFITSAKDCPGVGRGSKLPKGFFEKLARKVIGDFESCSKLSSKHCYQ